MHIRSRLTSGRVTLLIAAAAVALVAIPALPANAAPGAGSSTGWVRVAHLSPDTTTMDVRLVPLAGSGGVVRVDDVSYGTVSSYRSLAVGQYAVAMRPAGSSADATPVVQTSIDVTRGGAATVAVFGVNADLKTKVIEDSLGLPKSGTARVRVIQAYTADSPVTVTAAPSTTIVDNAATATVSPYADVKAGTWKLTAVSGSRTATASVALAAGQVASVVVLDTASGGIVLRRVLDSASVGGVPKGYLATGGGYLAHQQAQQQEADVRDALVGGGALVLVLIGAGFVLRRRRRA